MKFSDRTAWQRQFNPLTDALESLRSRGAEIADLTLSNPTLAGLRYPSKELSETIAELYHDAYRPDPRGSMEGRAAIAEYYRGRGMQCSPNQVVLTAGTSQAYAMAFMLLCRSGDSVLAPVPSYPLFEYLGRLHDVRIVPYHLRYAGEWHIDLASVRRGADEGARAIILVDPHNPTGMFAKRDEYLELLTVAREHEIAIIIDEVFSGYRFEQVDSGIEPGREDTDVLTITLNGVSKLACLPHMKIAWMLLRGEPSLVGESMARLDIVSDSFLSVNPVVSSALPRLLSLGGRVRADLIDRIRQNRETLVRLCTGSPVTVLRSEGGWYSMIRMPSQKSDEEWALELLSKAGVFLHPGYFFDAEMDSLLVTSMLPDPSAFASAMQRILRHVRHSGV